MSSLPPLAALVELTRLSIFDAYNFELYMISSLKDLKSLYVCNTGITDLEDLKNHLKLETLDIRYCYNIEDISIVRGLKELKVLVVRGCTTSLLIDIESLRDMTSLKTLEMMDCDFVDVEPLYTLKNLTRLLVDDDIEGLEKFKDMEEFKDLKIIQEYSDRKNDDEQY